MSPPHHASHDFTSMRIRVVPVRQLHSSAARHAAAQKSIEFCPPCAAAFVGDIAYGFKSLSQVSATIDCPMALMKIHNTIIARPAWKRGVPCLSLSCPFNRSIGDEMHAL